MPDATGGAENGAPKYVLFRIGDGWSALYVDGRLDRIGDSYNVDERIAELLGVSFQESEVMDAIQQRRDAPSTLADLRGWEVERTTLLQEAEALRARAATLTAEADALSGRAIPPVSSDPSEGP